jgi:hypothetical protein
MAQVPDSLQNTFIAKLSEGDTLTMYISRRNCFGGRHEKLLLTKSKDAYKLIAYRYLSAYEVHQLQLDETPLEKLPFRFLKTYTLSTENVVALTALEHYGTRCGMQQRKAGGAIGNYQLKINNREKSFSNTCSVLEDRKALMLYGTEIFEVDDLEELAFPATYEDDNDE